MVPEGRWHAPSDVCTVGEAALRSVPLACGTGRDRAPAGVELLHAGDRSSAWAGGVDHLPGVAAQRRHPVRRSGVSCDDSAVARRAIRATTQAGEACAQRVIANLCAGAIGRRCCRPERGSRSRPGCIMERPSAWTAAGPEMGARMEPRADRPPSASRLPGRHEHAHQP